MRALVVLLMMSTAAAAQDCKSGSADVVTVEDWSVDKVEDALVSGVDITMVFRSHASKPFRMIDGSYTFQDVLGRRISSFQIDPDSKAAPKEAFTTVSGYLGRELDRVPKMAREDVVIFACTRALVYDDGTKEYFKR